MYQKHNENFIFNAIELMKLRENITVKWCENGHACRVSPLC